MYVYVHEKSVALFEQPLSWACVFSSEGRGMYTYLTNGARRHSRWLRRRHDGIPAQREPRPARVSILTSAHFMIDLAARKLSTSSRARGGRGGDRLSVRTIEVEHVEQSVGVRVARGQRWQVEHGF